MSTAVQTSPSVNSNDTLAASLGGLRIYELTLKAAGQVRHEIFTAKNMDEAISLGQEYCQVHGSRFIFVSLWLRDLRAAIERKKSSSSS